MGCLDLLFRKGVNVNLKRTILDIYKKNIARLEAASLLPKYSPPEETTQEQDIERYKALADVLATLEGREPLLASSNVPMVYSYFGTRVEDLPRRQLNNAIKILENTISMRKNGFSGASKLGSRYAFGTINNICEKYDLNFEEREKLVHAAYSKETHASFMDWQWNLMGVAERLVGERPKPGDISLQTSVRVVPL